MTKKLNRLLEQGMPLAFSYFPPPVSVPVILGMLFQQILAALFGKWLEYDGKRKTAAQSIVPSVEKRASGG